MYLDTDIQIHVSNDAAIKNEDIMEEKHEEEKLEH